VLQIDVSNSSFSYPTKGNRFLEGCRESVSQQCTGASMNRKTVGRRGALSGSLAAVLVAAPGSGGRKGIVQAAPAYQAQNAAREDVSHSPFLVAFLAWLSTASDRLVLPVSLA
jgi:hypothetical protein